MIYVAIAAFVVLTAANPHMHWPSYWITLSTTVKDKSLPKRSKLKLLWHLFKDLLLSPIHCLLWLADDALFTDKVEECEMKDPVFIISQPRSGSTFLHRLLAEDDDVFFAITYFEWKWPYICVWKLVDLFRLRKWINKISYWSRWTKAGKLANKMHPHVYGDHEEHGVFLEEKFYHHYFVFRRFPFPAVLQELTEFHTLHTDDKRRILDRFQEAVRKVHYYRGRGKIWITKENESVLFYKTLLQTRFPKAACLFLVRDCEDMLPSYFMLSRESTKAKTGVDKLTDPEWFETNLKFRQDECGRFYDFYCQLLHDEDRQTMLIQYDKLTSDIFATVYNIYSELQLPLSLNRSRQLKETTRKQRSRDRGYSVLPLNPEYTDRGFNQFCKLVLCRRKYDEKETE